MKRIILAALLCSSAIIAPDAAEAGPVVSFVAGIFGASFTGASVGAYLAGVGFAGSFIGSALLRIGASILLSAAARALGPRPPGAPELIRDLQVPQSLVPKRFIYGSARIYGSPIWRVRDDILYGCLVLNSRPSQAFAGLYLDKRACALSGNPYDFSGPGAVATAAPFEGFVTVWVGLGDQTSCPDAIVAEAPGLFAATDAGQGLTVIWLRLDCGPNSSRAERWPRTPPEVEVEGQWSKIWDPRDSGQDPDDPATWEWSANQALCALDAARNNPIRRYPLPQIDLDSFIAAADLADEFVLRKSAPAERRYQVNGALIFNGSEIMDQLLPLFAAGASDPVRIGGRLAIAPGAYTPPIAMLTDLTEAEGLTFQRLKPGRDLATTVRCTFTDPLRDWRTSELREYTVPGAVAEDGGVPSEFDLDLPLVTSPTQAMRIQKIRAIRQRAQRQLTATLPPWAFGVVAGANVTVNFPAPYAAVNGVYRVASANPGLFASEENGNGGVAMRVPVVLDEIAEADFAWDAETEEQDRPVVVLNAERGPVDPPGPILATSGAAFAIGGPAVAVAGIRFSFDPSESASVVSYEWQYKLFDVLFAQWTPGGVIDADVRDSGGKVFGLLYPAASGLNYQVRVRAIGRSASAWVESPFVMAVLDLPRYTANFETGVYFIDDVPAPIGAVFGLTRSSAATFVNESGLVQTAAANVARFDYLSGQRALLVEAAGQNAFTFSEDLTNAIWVKARVTVTANAAVAPDGATTADKIVETATTGTHLVRRARATTGGERVDFVLHAKAVERSIIRVTCIGSGMVTQRALVNLATGAVTIVNGSPEVVVRALANGWWRIEFGFVPSGSAPTAFLDVNLMDGTSDSYAGDGTSGVLLWGIQDGAGSYIPTASSVGFRAADAPEMRGVSANLKIVATYDDASTAVIDSAPVLPGYWPTLTRPRLLSLIGMN